MDEILELLKRHVSVRQFLDEPIPADVIREAFSAAQMASTSSHVQAYSAIHVRDPETRSTLVDLTGGQPYVASAGAFFAICADERRHRLIFDRAGQEHARNLETFLVAIVDASLFAQNLVVAFEALGYGICYIGGLRNQLDEVDRLLDLPEHVMPLYGLCVGVPDPAHSGRPKPRLPLDAVLFEDRYPSDAELLDGVDRHDASMEEYYTSRGLPGRNWSGGILRKFAELRRENLAGYYRGKGAVLD